MEYIRAIYPKNYQINATKQLILMGQNINEKISWEDFSNRKEKFDVDNLIYNIFNRHFYYLPIKKKEATLKYFIECHVKGTTDIENLSKPKKPSTEIQKLNNEELGKHGESLLQRFVTLILDIIHNNPPFIEGAKEKIFGDTIKGNYSTTVEWFNKEKESYKPYDMQVKYVETADFLRTNPEFSDSFIDKIEVKTTRFDETKFFYFSKNEIGEMLKCYDTNHKYIIARVFYLDDKIEYEGIQINSDFGVKFYCLNNKSELEYIYNEFQDTKTATMEVSPKFFQLLGKKCS